ncbi:uncharacterized protein LOC125060770 [Pieris napi]|uniref:Protein quiver n=2 Tax=Pieris macdunnoughi TaxID=345717 RepID=A0A821WSR8_9NEOP|nr:uncharacterized protein LOC125060770 [Pieris napi]CAF4930255.1 unnamed protein product [Pieris macdunnoughi]
MRSPATRWRQAILAFSLDRSLLLYTCSEENLIKIMGRCVAFTLAALLATIDIGSCLQCYQCNSQSDPTCKDPIGGRTPIVDCATQDSINYNRAYLSLILPRELVEGVTGAPRYCHKIVFQSGTTVRTCLDANPTELNQTCRLLENAAKSVPSDPSKQLKHCSVCDKDRCNGAGSIVASAPLALLALVATLLYTKQ